ncbi:MAG: hypothetical protein AABY46_04050 [Nitrospirota bacterium]
MAALRLLDIYLSSGQTHPDPSILLPSSFVLTIAQFLLKLRDLQPLLGQPFPRNIRLLQRREARRPRATTGSEREEGNTKQHNKKS